MPELLEVDIEPREQEEGDDPEGREEFDRRVVREDPQARRAYAEEEARDRAGDPVPLQEARHHEEHEQERDVEEVGRDHPE